VPQEAVKWAQEFPDYTVYKVVYDQTKMLSKEYFTGKKVDESEVTATTTVPTTSTTATVPIQQEATTTLLPLLTVLQQERKQVVSSLCLNVQN